MRRGGRACGVGYILPFVQASFHQGLVNPVKRERSKPSSTDQVTVVECPKCQAPQEVVPVTVLRPGAEALQALFKGALNRVTCGACGTGFVLAVPILYRDDAARFMVYFISTADPAERAEGERQMERVTKQIFSQESGLQPPTCRLVTDRSALIEKITLHERGFDDRIVEYVKYQLFSNPNRENRPDPVRHRLLFDFSADPDGPNLAFVIFDRESGRPTAGAHIPMEVYREVEEAFTTSLKMREELQALFPGTYVSVERLL